ncbi:MAG: hypothetical protein P8P74_06170 [Crocinitomicaceae bacterium]|nr:hypothetical protein [Crocinitomicaceae bacterium]
MRLALIFLILNCLPTFAQVVQLPDVELPEVEKPKGSNYWEGSTYVEAVFPGGVHALKEYMQDYGDHIPDNWQDSSFNKRGYICFVVEVDSTISEIEILRNISPEADSLAIELISNMPKWVPAYEGNDLVRSRVRLPITFSRSEEE